MAKVIVLTERQKKLFNERIAKAKRDEARRKKKLQERLKKHR